MDPRITLLAIAAGLMAMGAVLAVPAATVKGRPLWRRASRWAAIAGFLTSAAAAAIAWQALGRAPAAGFLESLMLLAPALALGYVFIEGLSKSREGGAPVLAAAAGAAFLAAMGAAAANPLIPTPTSPWLDSAWVDGRCVAQYLALGLLGAAGLQAATFLVIERFAPARSERAGRGAFWAVCMGLPFLVWSLLMGAVWSQAAKGTPWAWSSGEVWTLIYALALSAYVCLRHVGHWPERRAMWLLAISLLPWIVALIHSTTASL